MNLPVAFLENLKQVLTEAGMASDYEAFLASFDEEPRRAFRMNELKLADLGRFKALLEHLEERDFGSSTSPQEVPWSSDGLYFPPNLRPGKSLAYRAGLFYIQEASAMLPAELALAQEGEKWLDLCAAPGGKSARLAAKLNGKGLLWSNDLSASRAKALQRNLEQLGVANAVVTASDPKRLEETLAGFFDGVLIDAPCSGEGMFRRDERIRASWSPEQRRELEVVQASLLDSASKLLRPGGELVYSTCTYNPCENEEQIARFLWRNPDFDLVEAKSRLREGALLSQGLPLSARFLERYPMDEKAVEACLRIWPQREAGDGHFCAVLQKKMGVASEGQRGAVDLPCLTTPKALRQTKKKNSRRAELTVRESLSLVDAHQALLVYLKEFLTEQAWKEFNALPLRRFRYREEQLYLLPETLSADFFDAGLNGVKFMKTGLYLAQVKASRKGALVQLTHSYVLSLTRRQVRDERSLLLGAEDERVQAYLRGETLSLRETDCEHLADRQSHVLFYREESTQDFYPLGLVKREGSSAKNLYPAGWRTLA